ncbi:MAG: hypothetical protein ACLQPD_26210 [Desulfomonilaceae bacterium]
MDDAKEGRLSKQNNLEAKTLEDNPVAQALFKVLENDEPVRTCQFMSELLSLTEQEQAADHEECEP